MTDADDVLSIIAPEKLQKDNGQELAASATIEEAIIIKLISEGLRDGDEIQQKSGLSASDFATALTMLEINGAIKPLGANNWTLR